MPSDLHSSNSSPEGTVILTCPHCATILKTAADTSVEGPCPTCSTTIRYEAPSGAAPPAPPATFVPREPRQGDPGEPEFEKPRPVKTPRPKPLRTKKSKPWLHRADDFFYSRTGRAISCTALTVLFFYSVILFFKWDKRRRAQAPDPAPPPAVELTAETPANP